MMGIAMKRMLALAFGLLGALALAPFVLAQPAYAASPASWFDYEILAEGDEGAAYGAGAYIRGLTGTPDGEVIEGSFWDSSDENIDLPATLPDGNGNEFPVVYAQIPNGYASTLDATDATELRYLCCAACEVDTLLVYGLSNLRYLECSQNYLTKLNLGGCTGLLQLSCKNNYLAKLDVSPCANLEYLDCTYNLIKDTSALEGVASSPLSAVEPQRADIATGTLSFKSEVYDGVTSWYWDRDPVGTLVVGEDQLVQYDWEDEVGDYLVSDIVPNDPADDNDSYNRAGTYTATVTAFGDRSLSLLADSSCNWIGSATAQFTIKPLPLPKANVFLSKYAYAYDGKVKEPTATVKVNGIKQYAREYQIVTYWNAAKSKQVSPKNVGTYYAKVTAKASANTKGYVYRAFKINPKATANVKLTALNNGFKASWAKRTVQVDGYEVRYKAKGASAWTVKTVAGKNVGSKSFTGLKDKKTYQVQVRTYKKADGSKYYSAWTNVKSVKTK